MRAIRPSIIMAATVTAALGMTLIPLTSSAQGQPNKSKKAATIFKFRKNVENLDVLAKQMIEAARRDAKNYRGKTPELESLARHSELTGNLVKATLIGNPSIIRKASMDVDNNLKTLKLRRLKSNKNPDRIDKLINISVGSSDYLVNNLNEFNEANTVELKKTTAPASNAKALNKPKNPAEMISNILKKTFK